MGSVSFIEEDTSARWLQKNKIKAWIKQGVQSRGFKLGELNLILCSDAFLLTLNQDHLKHDFYTDIITFDYFCIAYRYQ
jgi:ssRNA-specific RNase YbeY (16S rRNA maturation enzyme)